MKLKIPNILTIGRIIVVPIFVITFFLPGMYGDLIPFFLFVGASFTDYLDGLLARLLKEESKLGELLDPIADIISFSVIDRPVPKTWHWLRLLFVDILYIHVNLLGIHLLVSILHHRMHSESVVSRCF